MSRHLIILFLFIFEESSTKPADSIEILRCDPKEEVVYGENLIIDCVLNSTHYDRTVPCKVKSTAWPVCHCGGKKFKCDLKAVSSDSNMSKIQKVTVEIYSVTISGIYMVSMEDNCGINVSGSIKINITRQASGGTQEVVGQTPAPPTTSTPPSQPSNLIMGAVVGVVVAVLIVAAVALWIRKRRHSTFTKCHGDYHQPTQQV